jgi:hypothetical protein
MKRSVPAFALLLVARAAHADEAADPVAACMAAAVDGQTARDAGHLLRAREQLASCLDVACPAVVRKDCAQFLDEVEAKLPSIVVRVRDAEGRDIAASRVRIDDRDVALALAGRSVALDPGPHAIVVDAGAHTLRSDVLLREGERGRIVDLALPPRPTPSARPSTLVWVLGGVGVAGLATFAVAGLTGVKQWNDLESQCKPNCESSRVDEVNARFAVADVSLAIAIAALGTATVLYLAAPAGRAAPHASLPTTVRF